MSFDVHRLLTVEGLTAAAIGSILTYAIMCWRLNMTHSGGAWKRDGKFEWPKLRKQFWAWVIIFAALLYIGYQNQQVRNDVVDLSNQTAECQKQFTTALSAIAAANVSDLKLTNNKIDAGARWLGTLLNPPPDIAALGDDTPERKQWAIGLTGDYLNELARIQTEQKKNDEIRHDHPLPQPTCGREESR